MTLALRRARRVVQALETRAPPAALLDQMRQARQRGDAVLADAIAASHSGQALIGTQISPYRRRAIGSHSYLFHDPVRSPAPGLLVWLTGRIGRMGLPTPLMLQALDAARWDVLYLSDPAQTHYRQGVPGLGRNLSELAATVRRIAQPYAHVVTLGASMGALPAVALGQRIGAVRGIGMGAARPWDIGRLAQPDLPVADLPFCACRSGAYPRGLLLCGADHAADRAESAQIGQITGVAVVPVPDTPHHLATFHFAQTGRLAAFLALLCDPALSLPEVSAVLRAGGPAP